MFNAFVSGLRLCAIKSVHSFFLNLQLEIIPVILYKSTQNTHANIGGSIFTIIIQNNNNGVYKLLFTSSTPDIYLCLLGLQ